MDNRSKQDRQREDLMSLTVSELHRLRKIEEAARRVYDWVNNDSSSQAVRLRRSLRSPREQAREPLVLLLYGLRKSLETINGGTQT